MFYVIQCLVTRVPRSRKNGEGRSTIFFDDFLKICVTYDQKNKISEDWEGSPVIRTPLRVPALKKKCLEEGTGLNNSLAGTPLRKFLATPVAGADLISKYIGFFARLHYFLICYLLFQFCFQEKNPMKTKILLHHHVIVIPNSISI